MTEVFQSGEKSPGILGHSGKIISENIFLHEMYTNNSFYTYIFSKKNSPLKKVGVICEYWGRE